MRVRFEKHKNKKDLCSASTILDTNSCMQILIDGDVRVVLATLLNRKIEKKSTPGDGPPLPD